MFRSTTLERAVALLGTVLRDRGLTYELVAIGGGSLLLLGWSTRPTKDLDIVAHVVDGAYLHARPFPEPLARAVADVASLQQLADDWMNAGPTDQLRFGLPVGFRERLATRHYGGLTLHLAGRLDQICLKLFAAADDGPRGKHFGDLLRLEPTDDELRQAAEWVKTQDLSEVFAEFVDAVVARILEDRDGPNH